MPETRTCQICGCEFEKPYNKTDQTFAKMKYCSEKCRKDAQREQQRRHRIRSKRPDLDEYYVFSCGCEVKTCDAYYATRMRIIQCKEHGGSLLYKKMRCSDCGEYFLKSPRAGKKLRCDSCQETHKRKLWEIANANQQIPRDTVAHSAATGDYLGEDQDQVSEKMDMVLLEICDPIYAEHQRIFEARG